MRLRLEPRAEPSRAFTYLAPVMSAGLTFVGGAALFGALGYDPLEALYAYFVAPVSTVYGISELGLKSTPLCLCAVGLAVGFRANVWNIGAEGQLTMGAIAGGGIALAFPESNGWWLLPAMLAAGILGGVVWSAIPAFLRTRFNASEILTSLMLSYVAQLALAYLVHGPWRDPGGFNFPESRQFQDAALLPTLIEGTRLNVAALFALAAVAFAWLLMSKSFLGFQIKVVGFAPSAADYAGFSRNRIVWLSLLMSGGLAGLAGIGEAAGPIGQLLPRISSGYGFAAIIVAFLGRLHPVGVLFASLLMALVYLGGESAQVSLGLPLAVTGVFQGMLLLFVLSCDLFIRYRLRMVWRGSVMSRQ